ncbi:uncharacterized protein RHO17_020285 isoform 1-T1 [Thomomys bottae]
MGQTVTTPLSLTLQHWKEVRTIASNQSVEVRKNKWMTLCSSEWPTFGVNWPLDGTFYLTIILQVKSKVMNPGPHGHPDQVPYIVTWEALVSDPPPWVKPFLFSTKPIVTPSAPALPPPLLPSPISHPPGQSSLYPTLVSEEQEQPSKVLPPEEGILVDLMAEEPPPYQGQEPPPRPSGEGIPQPRDPAPSPVAGRLRGRREPPPTEPESSQAFLLRLGTNNQLQHWPFSASDLYNWKNNNPPFSKDPSRLTSLIESILVTHQPMWDDCQQLLQALLTSEEKQRVFLEARKNVPGDNGRPTQLPNEIDAAFPLERPNWDFTTPEVQNRHGCKELPEEKGTGGQLTEKYNWQRVR